MERGRERDRVCRQRMVNMYLHAKEAEGEEILNVGNNAP